MYSNSIDEKINFNNKKDSEDVIFLDDSKIVNGKVKTNDWQGKKKNNLELANSYKRIYANTSKSKKYVKVKDCSTWLEFKLYLESLEKRLNGANFCKDRLCPICNWRRTLKVFGQASAVMDMAVAEGYEFIFLTLTQKNVKSEQLSDEITKMLEGFKTMCKRTKFKKAFKGYFRALEVTYNKRHDEYHPHFHIILVVNKRYFKSEYYHSHEDFVALWRDCMKLDYDPNVDVRRFKSATKKQLSKSLAEATKYTVKDADYLIKNKKGNLNPAKTDKVVHTLAEALFNRRLIAWGGVLKEYHKKLNLDDAEKGDLIYTGDEKVEEGLFIILTYRWNVGFTNYVLEATEKPSEK